MWSVPVDDRGFLRDMARDIIADIAHDEIDLFEVLVDRYFTNPVPPTVPLRYRGAAGRTISTTPRLSEVAPGVLMAALNYLVLLVEEGPQRPATDEVRANLKRLLAGGRRGPDEGVRIRPASLMSPERLTLVLYCYTQPLSASFQPNALYDIAYSAAQIYGLGEAQSAAISGAVVARICRTMRAD